MKKLSDLEILILEYMNSIRTQVDEYDGIVIYNLSDEVYGIEVLTHYNNLIVDRRSKMIGKKEFIEFLRERRLKELGL